MSNCDIGLIGLAVMGQNLVLNMARNGYKVAVYNRTTETMEKFVAAHPDANLTGARTIEEFVAALKRPRLIVILVKAGPAVDAVIEQLRPHLAEGDTLIESGNSYFLDSERRAEELEKVGLNFIGTGISGGEEGALWGPSIMPGGQREAYQSVEPIFNAIAAKAHDGKPCVAYIGPRGSGHYVKMVHNGIEYGNMQLIAEAYDIMKTGLALRPPKLADVFAEWNEGVLASYLIEITADVFRRQDDETGQPLVDLILDKAQQKGTGKWTTQNALDLGVPTPTINAGVEARIISAFKDERVAASKILPSPDEYYGDDAAEVIRLLHDALYCSMVCSYAQGMALLRAASQEYDYNLDLSEVAAIWRAGCIIRAAMLEDMRAAYAQNPALPNLLVADQFAVAVGERVEAWRRVLGIATALGIPTPAMSASLAYFDSYRRAWLPANLIQAQRDYFGAHTYERVDREGVFHTEWVQ